jgi:transposase-like protein
MAKNRVQFQKGMSEAEFLYLYGTEDQCRAALLVWRWPNGFKCPVCGGEVCSEITSRRLYQCSDCRRQVSLTAGTIFHASKLPLTQWFRAMYHLGQCKNGISALELSRRLGVAYNTAWMLHHKLMQVMVEREDATPLAGAVHVDDAYVGGARSDGTTGRGASGKTPLLAAVQVTPEGKPHRLKFSRVADFSGASVRRWAERHLAPDCVVHSDGWPGFAAFAAAGHPHHVTRTSAAITGQTRKQAAGNPTFRWINTLLGNLKTSLRGTFHAIAPRYVPRYLAQAQYRFNRRYHLDQILPRLANTALKTKPCPHRTLVQAEFHT